MMFLCTKRLITKMKTFINEAQEIRWSDEHWKYRVATNFTEYHTISNLIFLKNQNS